jgi:hypothetical protein
MFYSAETFLFYHVKTSSIIRRLPTHTIKNYRHPKIAALLKVQARHNQPPHNRSFSICQSVAEVLREDAMLNLQTYRKALSEAQTY